MASAHKPHSLQPSLGSGGAVGSHYSLGRCAQPQRSWEGVNPPRGRSLRPQGRANVAAHLVYHASPLPSFPRE